METFGQAGGTLDIVIDETLERRWGPKINKRGHYHDNARSSHERMDGTGYPDGRAGDQIPMPARIVLVADAFDALTSDRPYRNARTVSAAMEELRAHAGSQFCPQVIDALEQIYRDQPSVLGAATLRAVGDAAA